MTQEELHKFMFETDEGLKLQELIGAYANGLKQDWMPPALKNTSAEELYADIFLEMLENFLAEADDILRPRMRPNESFGPEK